MRQNRSAFSLVEVMVSLLIISLVVVALSGSQGVALNSARKGRFITIATMLAKKEMSELDIMISLKGFTYVRDELTEKQESTFDEEEYKDWKKIIEVKEVKFPISAIMKAYSAQTSEEEGGEQVTGQEDAIMGIISNNVETFMKDSVRELTVTVLWPVKGGKDFSSMKLVYYVVDYEAIQKFTPVM